MCKFCDGLNCKKEVNKQCPKDYKNEFTVAIVEHSWFKKNGKRSAGRTTDYGNKGLGYQLNFCPECGKKLNKKNIARAQS